MGNRGPLDSCFTVSEIDNYTSEFDWLSDTIAFSGRGVINVFFLCVLFSLAAIARALFRRTSMLHGGKLVATNHSLILIIVGCLICGCIQLIRLGFTNDCLRGIWTFGDSNTMDPTLMYFGLLPLLTFKPSFDLDMNFILRQLDSIIVFGCVSLIAVLILMTILITAFIEPFQTIAFESLNFPKYGEFSAISFGGMLATILTIGDPTLLTNMLTEIGGANSHITSIVENGNWFASCIAITLFEVFRLSVQAKKTWHHAQWVTTISWKLILSPIFGFLVAKINSSILLMIINDILAEVVIVLSTLYFTFATASMMGLSAPIAIIAYNVFLDHSSLSKDGEITVKKFVDVIGVFAGIYLAGTAGYVFLEESIDHNNNWGFGSLGKDVFYIFLLYLFVSILRILVMGIIAQVMRNQAIRYKEVIMISWGEVKGSINIILAFIVLLDPAMNWMDCEQRTINPMYALDVSRGSVKCVGDSVVNISMNPFDTSSQKEMKLSQLYGIGQQKVFYYAIGVLILTHLFNGLSLNKITEKLGIYQITEGQKATMNSAISKIKDKVIATCVTMKYDPFLADADWNKVREKIELPYPYKEKPTRRLSQEKQTEYNIKKAEESRIRALKALKTSFVKQRNKGFINDEVLNVLTQAVDSAQEREFISINQLQRSWKLFGIFPKLKHIIESHLYQEKNDQVRIPWRKRSLRRLHKAASSTWFEVVMQTLIFLNMISMFTEMALIRKRIIIDESYLEDFTNSANSDEIKEAINTVNSELQKCNTYWCLQHLFEYLSHVFLALYTVEVIFKALILTPKVYYSRAWNKFDFLIVAFSWVELIASLVIKTVVSGEFNSLKKESDLDAPTLIKSLKTLKIFRMIKTLRAFRALRMTRLLRSLKSLTQVMLRWINNNIYLKLSFGYDVGRGFIKGAEELDSALEMIAGDDVRMRHKLRVMSERNRNVVVRELGLLQRTHPGIAISVKTKTAIRNLVNVMYDSVRRLQEGGVLDEFEVNVLYDQINIKVKEMQELPIQMPTPPPETLFNNITWVNGDEDIAKFLADSSEQVHFDLGEFIIQDDEEPDSIYLIISGMVKIVHGEYHEDGLFEDVDVHTNLNTLDDIYDDDIEQSNIEYASTGLVVGELGCLVGENVRMSVICETSVTTYQIPLEVIHEAFRKFSKLRDSLWRVVGIKLGVQLLLKDHKWQGFSSEDIRFHLESSFIVCLEGESNFTMDDEISELILIDGVVLHNNERMDAPMLLQRTYQNDDLRQTDAIVRCFGEQPVMLLAVKNRQDLADDTHRKSSHTNHRNKAQRVPSTKVGTRMQVTTQNTDFTPRVQRRKSLSHTLRNIDETEVYDDE